jgi:hypothetical protein
MPMAWERPVATRPQAHVEGQGVSGILMLHLPPT